MFQLFKNLFIHGEGGDGAGAAPGAEAPAAEETGVTAPDAGEKRRLTKAERRARLEEQLKAQAQAQQPKEEAQLPEQKPEQKLYTQEEMERAITGRVKNLKDSNDENVKLKAEVERLQKLLTPLAEQQGIKPGADGTPDLDAIEAKNRQVRIEDYAAENGVSEEFAEERLQMQDRIDDQDRQLREYRAAEEARQKDLEQYQMFQKHRQQAEQFRQKMPGFDLVKEMEASPEFTRLIGYGVNVENAYYAIHHDELMAVGQQAAAIQAKRALSASIQAGQSMPAEGGLGRSPAASPQRAADLKFTKERLAEIRRRTRRGEEVYL